MNLRGPNEIVELADARRELPRGEIGRPRAPVPGAVEVWCRQATWMPATRETASLSLEEIRRAGAFRAARDAEGFIHARSFLRGVLSVYCGVPPAAIVLDTTCRHCGAQHGKPHLPAGPQIDFSLSYAQGAAVVAVTGGPDVGVDVEHRGSGRSIGDLTATIFAPFERRWAQPATDLDILCHWTRKEALLKATGHGLAVAPNVVELRRQAQRRWGVAHAAHLDDPSIWVIVDLDLGADHVGAVAVGSEVGTLLTTLVCPL